MTGIFILSRYEAPREEDKQKPFSYVGFGGGRHGCMGTNFAYLQVMQFSAPSTEELDCILQEDTASEQYSLSAQLLIHELIGFNSLLHFALVNADVRQGKLRRS